MPAVDDRFEAFHSSVGTKWRIAEHDMALTLVEATRVNEHAFSVVFHGPSEPMLDQASYTFVDQDDDEQIIFVVPIGPAPNGSIAYEAVFTSAPPAQ